MSMNERNGLLLLGLACGAVLALSVPAKAAFISGTLATTSDFTETATSLSFCPSPTTPCTGPTGSFNIPSTGTGDFADPYSDDPSGFTVTNLNSTNAPVGTVLATPLVFLTFNPSVALPVPDIELLVTEVLPGVGGTANCAAAPSAGQECTPTGSAVTFLNTAGGDSSATISILGEAERISTGEVDPLQIVFTAQFNTPFQTVLANFVSTGSISSSQSGAFTATAPTGVPEPMTSMLLGSGLLAFGILLRRKRRT
jgi:hypothetical protein